MSLEVERLLCRRERETGREKDTEREREIKEPGMLGQVVSIRRGLWVNPGDDFLFCFFPGDVFTCSCIIFRTFMIFHTNTYTISSFSNAHTYTNTDTITQAYTYSVKQRR